MARPDGRLLILAALLAFAVTLVSAAAPLAADDGPSNPAAGQGDGQAFSADGILPIREPTVDVADPRGGPGSVITPDERVQITDTAVYPWRAIAYLELYDAGQNVVGSCTGTFIGPDTVLTAGHCLYDSVDGWTGDVAVVPGKDGVSEPYGYQFASDWWVPDGWISSGGDSLFDWGVIKMPSTTMGSTVGWFTVANLTTDTLSRSDFTPAIVGYPGDKPEGTLWAGVKTNFVDVADFNLFYDIDTAPGQSGSAIFSANTNASFLGYIVGVHTTGGLLNSGSRIDAVLLNDIMAGCVVMGCSIAQYTEPPAGPTGTPTTTPTVTSTGTPTPTATATGMASATPGALLAWGNGDCRGGVDSVDALQDLRFVAKLGVSQEDGCLRLGDTYEVMGASPHMWGDADCDGGVGSLDALRILRFVARLDNPDIPGCPRVGDTYEVR